MTLSKRVTFKIAGGFKKFHIISRFIVRNLRKLRKYDVVVYDALGDCVWNGGRINYFSATYDEQAHNFYKRMNIRIALTFSNNYVRDLRDPLGNYFLELFHEDGNEIIIQNYRLHDYIKKNFPKYKFVYSITGVPLDSIECSEKDIAYYKKLEQRFDFIVPRMEHVLQENFLNNVDLSKYVIMLNDTCTYNCPYWKAHFRIYHKINAEKKKLSKKALMRIHECWLSGFNPNTGDPRLIAQYGDKYGMDLKTNQIAKLLVRGVTRLKFSGRENPDRTFEEELQSYFDRLEKAITLAHDGKV